MRQLTNTARQMEMYWKLPRHLIAKMKQLLPMPFKKFHMMTHCQTKLFIPWLSSGNLLTVLMVVLVEGWGHVRRELVNLNRA